MAESRRKFDQDYKEGAVRLVLGGVERACRKERFARLLHRRGRVLGGPAARAAYGGKLSLSWLPRRVAGQAQIARVPVGCAEASLEGHRRRPSGADG